MVIFWLCSLKMDFSASADMEVTNLILNGRSSACLYCSNLPYYWDAVILRSLLSEDCSKTMPNGSSQKEHRRLSF